MEPEARYTLVGAVVIILVAICAALLIWLRSSGEASGDHRYKIYFEHQSLEGLQQRSDVTMRGMKVGAIVSLRFATQRPNAVEVVIAVAPDTPVRQSTAAVVERNLLTGLATLSLVNSTESSPLLTQAPVGEPYAVIAEGESAMQHLSQSIDQLAAHADETMQSINAALSPENRAALSDAIANLRVASRHLDATLAKADTALSSVGHAGEDVRSLASSLATDVHTLASRYDGLGAEATITVGQAREAVARITADADRLTQRADSFLVGGGDELRDTARSLRAAADAVATAAGRLRNPQQAILGPVKEALGPGEDAP
ncbi:MAG TPA: MlaD family protein [Casimicrobiaceae bacterium]|nr:MlaD family protein [Casimicrobiaceae bacterium]